MRAAASASPVDKGALAPQAAGVIHTDFERGFIKAEVVGSGNFDIIWSISHVFKHITPRPRRRNVLY